MNIDIKNELQFYLKNKRNNFIFIFIWVLLTLVSSIASDKKYSTTFSLYQKGSINLGFFSGVASMVSSDIQISLDALLETDQLYRHLASKKLKDDKYFWQIEEMENDFFDSIFLKDSDPQKLIFDRSVETLKESTIDFRLNSASQKIDFTIEHEDADLTLIIANEIVDYVNNYFSTKENFLASQKSSFVNLRMKAVEDELDEVRRKLIEFKENNVNRNSPKLREELRMLEEELILKSNIYTQLFIQYELHQLESVDKSNTVLLSSDPYSFAEPTSPKIFYNILLAIFNGFFLTALYSIKKNNGWNIIKS